MRNKDYLLTYLFTYLLTAPASFARQLCYAIVFKRRFFACQSVSVCLVVCATTQKLLNPSYSNQSLATFDFDLWPWELKLMVAGRVCAQDTFVQLYKLLAVCICWLINRVAAPDVTMAIQMRGWRDVNQKQKVKKTLRKFKSHLLECVPCSFSNLQ